MATYKKILEHFSGRHGMLVIAALGALSLLLLINRVVGIRDDILIALLLIVNAAAILFSLGRYRAIARKAETHVGRQEKPVPFASVDALTGLLDRQTMTIRLNDLLHETKTGRHRIAAAVINLDGFRAINDLHGHWTGDNLLRAVAETIRAVLPDDVVSARLSGDQFALGFRFDARNHADAEAYVQAVVDRLGKPFNLAGIETHISAAAGISASNDENVSAELLLRQADVAMRGAKRLGRGRIIWFDKSMSQELQNHNEMEQNLREGIARGEFVPYFEQQIDLASGHLEGFEMLARWLHPEKGLVAPDKFITIAEECGLISDLSLSVMHQAMIEARGWDNALTLSVNISPIQLKDPWLAHKITKLLNETGFPAERLEVEITERALLENLDLARTIIISLKNQGVRLALDDFGTGYSSLAHLRALPFDRVKIDRSFVLSINDNPESAAVVSAITNLASSLNLAITAEGVENETIEARLRSIGSYNGQGWRLGKPMPVAEVRTLLAGKGLLAAARGLTQPLATRARISRAG